MKNDEVSSSWLTNEKSHTTQTRNISSYSSSNLSDSGFILRVEGEICTSVGLAVFYTRRRCWKDRREVDVFNIWKNRNILWISTFNEAFILVHQIGWCTNGSWTVLWLEWRLNGESFTAYGPEVIMRGRWKWSLWPSRMLNSSSIPRMIPPCLNGPTRMILVGSSGHPGVVSKSVASAKGSWLCHCVIPEVSPWFASFFRIINSSRHFWWLSVLRYSMYPECRIMMRQSFGTCEVRLLLLIGFW